MGKELLERAEQAGIVGAGGAGFPTHAKLNAKADTVIINGAECEPLLRVDQQLMKKCAEELLQALDMIVEQVGAETGVVGVKEHYAEAVQELQKAVTHHPKLKIHLLGAFYPAGDEQVLVCEVTGRVVPEGGIPLNVGVVVCNVETALNLYNAVKEEKPVIEKYVTLTGAVKTPKSVLVPVGTSVKEVLKLAGGPTVDCYQIINGGPMMGKLVSEDSFITKTTKGLIVLPEDHPLLKSLNKPVEVSIRDARIACMQCSLCTEVCPRSNLNHRLHPHKLMRVAAYGGLCDENETPMNAFLCCGCRLCEYACVMDLQPWKLNTQFKGILGKNGIRNTLNAKPEAPSPFRELKRYPVAKLIHQLSLAEYDVPAPMDWKYHSFPQVTIELKQNVGAPAEPVVKVGDKVKKADLIAKIPDGKLGANLHASIDGTVTEVTTTSMTIKA